MPLRPPAGFISANYDPLKVADAPTIGTATGGDAQASVAFTAPSNTGGSAITAYYAVSNPGQVTASGASSPVTVTGLTNGTAYTFQVWALNSYGPSPYSAASGSVTPIAARGIFAGGTVGLSVFTNAIVYISIATTGNALDFGDLLSDALRGTTACASSSRGVIANSTESSNVMEYVTFATLGNAQDFGDLTQNSFNMGSGNNSTRGLFAGGQDTGGYFNVIQYITIASIGNATDFGDLPVAVGSLAGCSSPTRTIFGGGTTGSVVSTINYVTTATLGNATNFGNLTAVRRALAAASNDTRGVFAGGTNNSGVSNIIDYVTIATTGSATDFGDLLAVTYELAGVSNSTRAVFGGGADSSINYPTNVIQYVTIASTGNAIDFGDLTQTTADFSGCSSANGGL